MPMRRSRSFSPPRALRASTGAAFRSRSLSPVRRKSALLRALVVEEEEVNSDDEFLAAADNAIERQLAFQEQVGGSAASGEPGRLEFKLNPYVDRVSERMGVKERLYTANLRQRGQFTQRQNLNAELCNAVYSALQSLILRERIPDRDHVYFNLASNRLNHVYGYRHPSGLQAVRA